MLRLEEQQEAMIVNEYTGQLDGEKITLTAGPGGWFVRRVREIGPPARWRMEVSRSGHWYDTWQTVEVDEEPLTRDVPESTRP
ncbi:MAG TPA: hypothetical protein DC048_13365 [Planctomycetaceae bacterium]|nr:hypothetical protein [Planctomycetaceae bacterium]